MALDSIIYAGRTWTIGDVFYVPNASVTDGGCVDAQAARVAKIDQWGVPEFAVAGDHVNHTGRVIVATGSTCWRDTYLPTFWDDGDDARDAETIRHLSGPAPASLVRATRIVEKSPRKGSHPVSYTVPKGAVVHVSANGEPLCGSKVSATASNEDRWDPWRKISISADERASVYLPSFQAPTCAKCAAHRE